jgi:hypothetical protein
VSRPPARLVDERDPLPLRARIGRLLADADDVAFALARVRLAALDLGDRELGRLGRCRVLLGQLDASMLMDASAGATTGGGGDTEMSTGAAGARCEATPAPGSPRALMELLRFAASGRLEVRSAGLVGWTPDFAVVRRGQDRTGLLGSIQFGSPELAVGPTFTMLLEDPDATLLLQRRFDEVWDRSHDVLPAIQAVIERAGGLDQSAAGGGGGADPGRAVR